MDDTNDVFDTDLRFDDVTVGAERFAALALVVRAERGHHNDLDIFGLGGTAQDVEHVKTADFWHHDVADDQLWTFFDGHCQCFFAVAGRYDVIALGKETDAINIAQVFVIFDKHNLCHSCLLL